MRNELLVSLVLLVGCAAHPDPIIDTQGVNLVAYQRDLADCQSYAEQVQVSAGVAKGSAAGAAYGAAIGAIRGDIGQAAGVGAVSGGAWSGLEADREKQRVVKRCLTGRGYRVLN